MPIEDRIKKTYKPYPNYITLKGAKFLFACIVHNASWIKETF